MLPLVETVPDDDLLSDSDSTPSDTDSVISMFDDYDAAFGINAVRMDNFDIFPSDDVELDPVISSPDSTAPSADSYNATCTCCASSPIDQFLTQATHHPPPSTPASTCLLQQIISATDTAP